jgi:N-acetyl-gamma-glutamyl-phosphate reductase
MMRKAGMIKAAVVGGSGYTGSELARILCRHPEISLDAMTSRSNAGVPVAKVLPSLQGFTDLSFDAQLRDDADYDIVFCATPHGASMAVVPGSLARGIKVIDLSADFRLRDAEEYRKWYKLEHSTPQLIDEAVYGLPELYRDEIRDARLIANPGCYVTSALLALAPIMKAYVIDPETIIIDSMSGYSGVGRSKFALANHFPEANESARAYGVASHRHTPEIEQELSVLAGTPVIISFTPHVIPITRGILSTVYGGIIGAGFGTDEFIQVYREFYNDSPFVQIMDEGEYPTIKSAVGSNFCRVAVKVDDRTNRLVVVSAIDNLIKGMAGQAVQNMNLMYGLDERTGIILPGMYP